MLPKENSALISFCRELIQIPSLSGNEEGVAQRIRQEMLHLDYDEAWIDQWGNVIGRIKGHGPKKLLWDGHIDTVEVSAPGLWSYSPFGGEMHQGRIYGRGASDMKGAMAAMVYAGKELIQEKDSLQGDLFISGTVFEETLEGGSLARVLEQVNPDFVVIGEASELKLKIGQRGRAELVVTTEGRNAHSANPQKGYNAVYAMMQLINRIREIKLPVHDFLGEAIMELTDIISSPYPGTSVVPGLCKATFDRRLLIGEKKEDVLGQMRNLMAQMGQEDPAFKGAVSCAYGRHQTYTGEILEGERFFPAWLMDRHSEIVEKSVKALENLGGTPEITSYSFCTNGSCSAGIWKIPTVGFGPSREDQAHVVDEYINIEELEKASLGFFYLAKELLK
ncbi:hypothetical protein DCMF_14615 [Candidatus Formimonas warabiya]|uniref:Peptidase M20 dimerisation domain-containing protein n=2 Tax=Formimonas warabiya TaxID=1761012 RepID=A0A3G1L2D3_FORW1|nr:hypothetical protein DCMF_14615 [Candidatus Formimonas warabiya]